MIYSTCDCTQVWNEKFNNEREKEKGRNMKTSRKICLFFSAFALVIAMTLLGQTEAKAERVTDPTGKYVYEIKDGKAEIVKYNGTETNVVIPSTLGGKPVAVIGSEAFKWKKIESVSFPNTIVSIDYKAFMGTSLKTVTIPEKLTNIAFNAFSDCENLERVNFNATNCGGTVSPVFSGCPKLKTIVIGPKVTAIGSNLFAYTPIESISIPTSVKSIDYKAFRGTKLKSVTIGEQITNLAFNAFSDCENLEKVTFNAVNCGGTVSPVFSGCPKLKTIVIGSKVTAIGSYMFSYTPIESITLGKSVKSIDYKAFKESKLKKINLPEKLQNISFGVFEGCANLKDIYYAGSSYSWKKVNINKDNDELFKAKMHYAKAYVYKSKILKASKKFASKKISIKLQKVSKSSGYRIQISTDKKFKKLLVDKKITKTSYTLSSSKLAKKKVLYIRVKNTLKYNGKNFESGWSSVYKVKISK